MRLLNLIFTILMIILGGYITASSYIMGGTSVLFPKLIGILLTISSILLLIVTIIKKDKLDEVSPVERGKILRFLYTIILMIVYTIIIRFIGTYISTVFLFVGMALILAEDVKGKTPANYVKLSITSFVIVGIIYSIFKFILNVPLPEIF